MTKRPASKRSSAKKAPATKKRARAAPPARQAAKKTVKSAKTVKRATSVKSARSVTPVQSAKKAPTATEGRVLVQNVNVPGYTTSVDAAKYAAMKEALLKVLPDKEPGLTQAEMFRDVKSVLSPQVFPGGEKSEWWTKCVQLDLEAKGAMKRTATKPLRWLRA